MPDKVIEIPGAGRIAFPDSMSDSDIEKAAAKLYKDANPDHPPVAPSHSWVKTATDWLPAVGGAVGGTIGGIGGTVAGFGVGGVPGAIGGAALGGATGEALKQLAQRFTGQADTSPTALGTAGAIAGEGAIQGGMQAAGGLAEKAITAGGPALMRSALKPAYKLVDKATKSAEIPRVVKTLLDEGVNVSSGGIGKLNDLFNATNDELSAIIKNSAKKVFPENVIARGEEVAAGVEGQVASLTDESASKAVVDDFAVRKAGAPNYPLSPMSVQRAQQLKQGTYRSLGNRAYGETKGAAVETEKAMARGLKEGIEAAHPEVKGLNAREGSIMEARDAVAKRVAMAANRDPVGLGWLAHDPVGVIGFAMSRSPVVKSMLARGLYQSAQHVSGVPADLLRLAVTSIATSQDVEP